MISAKKSKRVSQRAMGRTKMGLRMRLINWWKRSIRIEQELDQCERSIKRASKEGKMSVDYPIKKCNLEGTNYYDIVVALQDKLISKGYTVMNVSHENTFYDGRTILITWEVAYADSR